MAAVKASRKPTTAGSRVPPPPIASSTSPIEIYDTIDTYEQPSPLQPAHVVRRQPNQRGLPPVPLADDNEYVQGDDYLEPDDFGSAQENRDQYYVEPIASMSQADEYYVDTASNSYNSRAYVTNQQDCGYRYEASAPGRYPEDLYEGPQFEDGYYDPQGYPVRKPVDRRQSRKNMGRAIVTGLNTARVKDLKQRLRPVFGPDELIDSVERRHSGVGAPQNDIENVDVSGLSVMERMKLLESKAASNKGPPPPTFPKPRPKSMGALSLQPDGHNGSPSSAQLREDRPAIPTNRSEPRLITASSSPKRTSQVLTALDESPWYFGMIDHHRCEEKLKGLNTEGAFLIRMSKKGEARNQPYTLCVFHEGDIYHLMIRLKPNSKLAVGSEKNGEPEFATLADLVKFHADIPIEVVPKSKSRKSPGGRVWLKMSPLK